MIINKDNNYIDYFKQLFSAKDIENIIKDYKLEFNNIELKFLENFNFDPIYFVYSFYNLLFLNNKIPTQNEFVKYYLQVNLEELKNGYLSKGLLYSKKNNFGYTVNDLIYYLIWRLKRIYPSYIRDLHFSVLLNESLINRKIIYNPELDVKQGIDILIDDKYKINLFTDTIRANFFRNKKYNRHNNNINLIDINLSLTFKEANKVGQFYLYGEKQIELLKNEINKFEIIND